MTGDGRLDDLDAVVQGLRTRLNELELAFDELASSPRQESGVSSPATPDGDDLSQVDEERLAEWVSAFWLPTFRRDHNQTRRWCPSWRHHPEAVWRFEGVRRAWVALAIVEPTGLGVWFRDYADPCLAALQSPDGPFAGCTVKEHRPLEPLPDAGPA